jgi:hypothetical protein
MIPISVIVQIKHHLRKRRTRAHKIIKFHPILMKDAVNVPNSGKEHDATVQGALTPVTDKVFSKNTHHHQSYKNSPSRNYTYICLYIHFYINAISIFNYIYMNNFMELLFKK